MDGDEKKCTCSACGANCQGDNCPECAQSCNCDQAEAATSDEEEVGTAEEEVV